MDLKKEFLYYIKHCQNSKQLSAHTIKAYCIDWKQFISYKSDMSISKEDVTDYVEYLHSNYKPKSVHRKIASLKAFIHHLYRNDIIDHNPFDKMDISFKEPILLPRTIPQHIIQQILSAAYTNIERASSEYKKFTATRNAAMIELLFATGARIFEICTLKVQDVDLDGRTIRILGKGSKERIIQIENEDVVTILKRYKTMKDSLDDPNQYFFLNNRNMRFSEQSARNVIYNLEKQINSNIHITPHMFRHSVATLLLEEDVDIRYIQKILGHSSIRTTEIYTSVTSAKQKEILRTKHPRNKMHVML